MKTCIIFCAAEFDGLIEPVAADALVIAADGGLRHTDALGLRPRNDSRGRQPAPLRRGIVDFVRWYCGTAIAVPYGCALTFALQNPLRPRCARPPPPVGEARLFATLLYHF